MAFSWAPAGCIDNFAACWLYITYGRTGVSVCEHEIFEAERYAITKLPDRTIFTSYRQDNRPLDTNFDECYYTGPYEPGSVVEQHCEFTLISAHTAQASGIGDRSFLKNKLKVCVDSGGAQLKLGTSKYICPYNAIETMNRVADVGMSLDLPPRPIDHSRPDVYDVLIKGTKNNNKVFFDYKADHVKLMNCIHGYSLDSIRRWAHECHDDRFFGWAAGTDNAGPMTNLRTLMVPMIEFPKAGQYHQFGFSGKTRLPIAAWLGRHSETVTSDSSTWVTVAAKRMYLATTLDGQLKSYPVGEKQGTHLKKNMVLPCSCPICHRVKYWQFFQLPPRTGAVTALSLHNFYVLANYANFWNFYAQNSTLAEYADLIRGLFKRQDTAEYMAKGCEYIDFAFDQGLEKAESEYQKWLGEMPSVLGGMQALFDKPAGPKEKASAVTLHLKGSAIDYARRYVPELQTPDDEAVEAEPEEVVADLDLELTRDEMLPDEFEDI